ncbi:hypothetical protein GLOIN_2v1778331 [Rhizophagus irregularis DAOM 181602=DAOM 197198]|uniref:Skt5p n=1 Tax=Rhizophagus irregularis (strain DAOM 181602 / DAOM 197198 / MUCL 43194) TaxID=747089 RepID=A0A2P4PSH1_RHIID|nr:hypothetical protein GLOIN_2v1778331 [Rhizophagus irregularis DAOM 181602=DAOM 197198]POG68334.1 hypothetical protein GLOIN_2v1778331 [Rhizophagus irregularis DAOM 181602=DAOM 197198]|eukprot:XP_025175200.1 hypothetical protein GLOIN_2v1778331 [Rhizophagus irregularis DAOM 181602=DAOM 197198]
MYKRQRTSNSTIKESRNSSNPSGESFDDARNDLLDDPTLDEFIMDINTPHNSTSFNNESLEESDKSPIKKSNSNVTKRLLHYKPNINLRDGLLHLLHVVHKNLYLIMNQICINKFYTIGVKNCWNYEPDNRPTVNQVIAKLDEIIQKENVQLSSEQKNNIEVPKNIIDNSLHGEMSQFIENFNNMSTVEIEPLISSNNKFNIMVNEIILHLENTEMIRKKHKVINYLNNHNKTPQEFYAWLLNNQNDSNSTFLLGVFNHFGIEVNVDEQKAFDLYQNVANSGNVFGITSLGYCYVLGIGISVDQQKAFELYQEAANLGNPRGIFSLGYCYDNGIGTNINKQKAFELYQKAANLGNSGGIYNLGCCYKKGIGTDIDKQKAFELYQESANFGNSSAQYNLALMYENGEGIKKDINQATYWYNKSAEQGDQGAQNKLNKLNKRKWKIFV